MTNQPLAIHAKCRDNKCIFEGKDLFIEIAIINRGSSPVGFPLSYRQKTGPSIRLIDKHTKAEAILRTNPVDPALANEFTQIAPGQSATLEWVIKPSEIQQFARPEIDLLAEITVGCKIQVSGELVNFQAIDSLQIGGRANP